jgi:invasion protein IalB
MRFRVTVPVLTAALAVLATGAALAQEVSVKATHGDWRVHCPEQVTETNPCAMFQELLSDQDRRLMSAIVMSPPSAEPFLRIIVPLGVLLPGGMTLTIDGTEVGTVGFINCLPDGCMTQVALKPDVLEQLKQGNEATVTVYEQTEQPVKLPISLSGFTAAYDEL